MFESIIIDTDLGSSTDDVATICMAYSYMRQGRAKLLGIVVDRMGEQNAVFADVLNTYFGLACVAMVWKIHKFSPTTHILLKKRELTVLLCSHVRKRYLKMIIKHIAKYLHHNQIILSQCFPSAF